MQEKKQPFKCISLSYLDSIKRDKYISDFFIKKEEGKGLEIYLKQCSINDEITNNARTYLVIDEKIDEIVGYFSLKAGTMSFDANLEQDIFETIPGIELSNFAVNDHYKFREKGLGVYIFVKYVMPLCKDAANIIGCAMLYIFSLPYEDLMYFYQDLGFERLDDDAEQALHRRLKPSYDTYCIFMYQQIPN